MLILLHEWESVPAPGRQPMPKDAHHKFDYLALGTREYGARSGVWRLLDVLDRHAVKATVIASGLVAELFPESVLTDPTYVKDGKVTEAGITELRKRMPFANLDSFAANPNVKDFGKLFTVGMICKYVESKVNVE